jgi:hypothetical protein
MLVKNDLMALFRDFHAGSLPLFNLNFGIITLLPKEQEANRIQQYRPISVLKVNFKIFTKVLANKISLIACKVIKPSQTAFLLGGISWKEWSFCTKQYMSYIERSIRVSFSS